MNMLVILAGLLFILMVSIGGKKGARSFVSLFLNFGVIMITVILMASPDMDPIILTMIACIIISMINLFYINEINSKTITAFISTLITIAILFFFIYYITKKIQIEGFGEEEYEDIRVFSLYIGVDFIRISASVIIMSTIGAITDVAISITSPLREILMRNKNLSKLDLFKSGLTIGKDILGSNANTLFFAFIGGYMALLIWFKDLSYSFGEIINSKIFSAEMIMIMFAGIGIAIIIPIASWISASYLIKEQNNKQDHLNDIKGEKHK